MARKKFFSREEKPEPVPAPPAPPTEEPAVTPEELAALKDRLEAVEESNAALAVDKQSLEARVAEAERALKTIFFTVAEAEKQFKMEIMAEGEFYGHSFG